MNIHFRTALFLGICVAALSGCTKKLDGSQVEENIKTNMKAQTGTEMKSVECPKDIEAKSGATFECKAAATSGEDIVVLVTQDDDQGKFTWKVKTVNGKAPTAGASAAPATSASPG